MSTDLPRFVAGEELEQLFRHFASSLLAWMGAVIPKISTLPHETIGLARHLAASPQIGPPHQHGARTGPRPASAFSAASPAIWRAIRLRTAKALS